MTAIKEDLLSKIYQGLLDSWMVKENIRINDIVKKMPTNSNQGKSSGQLVRIKQDKRETETNKSKDAFQKQWDSNFHQLFSEEFKLLYDISYSSIIQKHPWLLHEENALENKSSLVNTFIYGNIKELILALLTNNTARNKSWGKITCEAGTNFSWNPVDINNLNNNIQGFPLSNDSFYDDRKLPSFLNSPFILSPSRYDIYRLLKNNHSKSFSPQKLSNGRFCTSIAPFHHTELANKGGAEDCQISEEEWGHLQKILINIHTDEKPQWILLDKTTSPATLYVPDFLEHKIPQLKEDYPLLADSELNHINITGNVIYNTELDWHAILFSRILPWTQIETANKPNFHSYRTNIPIYLLLQNLIESSCLKAQTDFYNSSLTAFNTRSPLSSSTEDNIYSDHLHPETLFRDIPITDANTIIAAFDSHDLIYHSESGIARVTINRNPALLIEALKIAFFKKVDTLEINISPDASLNTWFECNLDITTVISSHSADCELMYACAGRNRFLQKQQPRYLRSSDNQFEARRKAWEKTGEFIYQYLSSDEESQEKASDIAQMGSYGLDSLFKFMSTGKITELNCTFNLNSANSFPVER